MRDFVGRVIDAKYIKRAEGIDPRQVPEHLDSVAVALHQALDAWRFHDGPAEDVTLCVDALVALWSVTEHRISV
jgi:hypothetical protein